MKEEILNAIQVIKNVAAVYRGDLKEHTLIQDSIRLIEAELDKETSNEITNKETNEVIKKNDNK